MAITGKEIAQRLGLSTATVSLALNNRPGVNDKTRKAVLACRDALQRERDNAGPLQRVVLFNDEELSSLNDYGLFEQSYTELFHVLNAHGYLLQTKVYAKEAGRFRAQLEQLEEGTVGIIVFASNMPPVCVRELQSISVPILIFDSNVYVPGADNILIDNAGGISSAIELFSKLDRNEVFYLAHGDDSNFNFLDRRRAVRQMDETMPELRVHMVSLGQTVEEISKNALQFLQSHRGKPLNLLMENYQVSLEILRAAQMLQLLDKQHFPKDILPVCFDELPAFALTLIPWKLPMICVSHTEKANMAALRLIERIEGRVDQEFLFTVRTKLVNHRIYDTEGISQQL